MGQFSKLHCPLTCPVDAEESTMTRVKSPQRCAVNREMPFNSDGLVSMSIAVYTPTFASAAASFPAPVSRWYRSLKLPIYWPPLHSSVDLCGRRARWRNSILHYYRATEVVDLIVTCVAIDARRMTATQTNVEHLTRNLPFSTVSSSFFPLIPCPVSFLLSHFCLIRPRLGHGSDSPTGRVRSDHKIFPTCTGHVRSVVDNF